MQMDADAAGDCQGEDCQDDLYRILGTRKHESSRGRRNRITPCRPDEEPDNHLDDPQEGGLGLMVVHDDGPRLVVVVRDHASTPVSWRFGTRKAAAAAPAAISHGMRVKPPQAAHQA